MPFNIPTTYAKAIKDLLMILSRCWLRLILFLFLIRLLHVSSKSLWLDEGITWWIAKDSFTDLWQRVYIAGGSSHLYYFIVFMWGKVFGYSELALRMPSIISSMISLLLVYRIASLVANHWFAICSALLFATQLKGFFNLFSARPYALLLAVALTAIFFLLKAEKENNRHYLILSSILAVIVPYFNVIFLYFLVIWGAFYLNGKRRLSIYWHAIQVLLLVPLLIFYKQISIIQNAKWLSFAVSAGVGEVLFDALMAENTIIFVLSVALASLYQKMLGFDKVCYEKSDIVKRYLAPLVFAWLFPYMLAMLAEYLFSVEIYVSRYMILAPAFFCVVFPLLLTRIISGRLIISGFGMYAFLVLPALIYLHTRGGIISEDWRGVVNYINSKKSAPNTIIYTGLTHAPLKSDVDLQTMRGFLFSIVNYYNLKGNTYYLPRLPNSRVYRMLWQEAKERWLQGDIDYIVALNTYVLLRNNITTPMSLITEKILDSGDIPYTIKRFKDIVLIERASDKGRPLTLSVIKPQDTEQSS